MKPATIVKNKGKIVYDVLFWAALYLLWAVAFQQRAFSLSRTITVQFCYLLFVAANYYFNILLTVPAFLYKKKYGWFICSFTTGLLLASALRVPLATFLSRNYFAPGHTPPEPSKLFLDSLVNISIWVVALVAIKLIIDRIRFQRYVETMEKEKIRNELDFLKAQFNPHFLFNSINSIYGNIDKQNSVARRMLLTFSELLRYQLYECNTDEISLEKEITYVRNYVAIQETRKPDNLRIELTACDNTEGILIAPLLFTAFIENAFKYVSHYDDRPNQVKIDIERNNGQVSFRVFNTKDKLNGHKVRDHGGIGIANVRRRLELLYPYKHDLIINSSDHSYEVILNLHVCS